MKPGITDGESDEYGIHVGKAQVHHVHGVHTTILHLMGLDHEHHTGRDHRLTDLHGCIVCEILA